MRSEKCKPSALDFVFSLGLPLVCPACVDLLDERADNLPSREIEALLGF